MRTRTRTTNSSRESKKERFERLAEKRVTEALRRLRLVGNLSNRATYDYTDEHIKQIVDALDAELRQLKSRFRQDGNAIGNAFSFKK